MWMMRRRKSSTTTKGAGCPRQESLGELNGSEYQDHYWKHNNNNDNCDLKKNEKRYNLNGKEKGQRQRGQKDWTSETKKCARA